MMRLLALAAACCAGCGDPASAPPPSGGPKPAATPVTQKKFTALMEAQDIQFDGLLKDVAKKAGMSAYQARIARFLSLSHDASATPFKAGKEQEALEAEFKPYFATLDQLKDDAWTDAAGNVRKLEAACNRCHLKFKED